LSSCGPRSSATKKAFWRRYEGEVISKQFLALPAAWRETRRLKPEDEAHAAAVAYAPVIFQKHVLAVADLRVTAVAGELFAAATDVRDAEYPQDVRLNFAAKYEPHDRRNRSRVKNAQTSVQNDARSFPSI
jgi:hypothetical protein